jgi:hypothetical protein
VQRELSQSASSKFCPIRLPGVQIGPHDIAHKFIACLHRKADTRFSRNETPKPGRPQDKMQARRTALYFFGLPIREQL